jgi:hypothetical protein
MKLEPENKRPVVGGESPWSLALVGVMFWSFTPDVQARVQDDSLLAMRPDRWITDPLE